MITITIDDDVDEIDIKVDEEDTNVTNLAVFQNVGLQEVRWSLSEFSDDNYGFVLHSMDKIELSDAKSVYFKGQDRYATRKLHLKATTL